MLPPAVMVQVCLSVRFVQWDTVLNGDYTPETVVEFLYTYIAYNKRGEHIWESRFRISRWYVIIARYQSRPPFLFFFAGSSIICHGIGPQRSRSYRASSYDIAIDRLLTPYFLRLLSAAQQAT